MWEGDSSVALWQGDRVVLRDMTEEGVDVLFDIQDDEVTEHMAAFTTPDGAERDPLPRQIAQDPRQRGEHNKVIVADALVVGSIESFVVEGDTEVTYWIRRDLWGPRACHGGAGRTAACGVGASPLGAGGGRQRRVGQGAVAQRVHTGGRANVVRRSSWRADHRVRRPARRTPPTAQRSDTGTGTTAHSAASALEGRR